MIAPQHRMKDFHAEEVVLATSQHEIKGYHAEYKKNTTVPQRFVHNPVGRYILYTFLRQTCITGARARRSKPLGVACAALFEQLAGVFASCGACTPKCPSVGDSYITPDILYSFFGSND